MNEQAQASKTTTSLEPASDIIGQGDFFASNTKDGFLGVEEDGVGVVSGSVAAVIG